MSTLEELKDALRDTLAARGSLGQIQARVRAEIFNALEETDDPKPVLSHENLLLNELIREYLDYNGYRHSLSVFLPETGQPAERLNRTFLAQELGLREDSTSRKLPLLYGVLATLQHQRARPPSLAPQTTVRSEGPPLEVAGAARMKGQPEAAKQQHFAQSHEIQPQIGRGGGMQHAPGQQLAGAAGGYAAAERGQEAGAGHLVEF